MAETISTSGPGAHSSSVMSGIMTIMKRMAVATPRLRGSGRALFSWLRRTRSREIDTAAESFPLALPRAILRRR
jgi:hypothetical protein